MASALSSARQQRMQPMSVLLALAGVLGAASWRSEMEPVLRQPQRAVALLPPLDALHHLTRLRGGADDEDDLLEEDEESDDALAESDGAGMDGLENPFLQGAQGAMGGGIQDLAASLKDPKVLQEALKELQACALFSTWSQIPMSACAQLIRSSRAISPSHMLSPSASPRNSHVRHCAPESPPLLTCASGR